MAEMYVHRLAGELVRGARLFAALACAAESAMKNALDGYPRDLVEGTYQQEVEEIERTGTLGRLQL